MRLARAGTVKQFSVDGTESSVSSDPVVLGIQGCTVANLKIAPDDCKRLEPLELCKRYEFSLYSHGFESRSGLH